MRFNPMQMMAQTVAQGFDPNQNPMVLEIMQLRRQGVDPQTAMQQLASRYPQFQQAVPFLQGKTPQQMDMTARNAVQSAGINPNALVAQLKQFF